MLAAAISGAATGGGDELRKAVMLYASFDDAVQADFAVGRREMGTRSGAPKSGQFTFAKGFNSDIFRIAKGKGIAGGALEATDILPDSGRIYFPMKDNIAFKKGGWGGAVTVWINTDPNTMFKGPFCDPVQITRRAARAVSQQQYGPATPASGADAEAPGGRSAVGDRRLGAARADRAAGGRRSLEGRQSA